MRRRLFLATPALLAPAAAHAWAPERPLTFFVPNGAGGTTDFAARLLAEALAPRLGQPVVVENRPGGNGAIAARAALGARADGHALLFAYSGYIVGTPFIVRDLGYDPFSDLAPVAEVLDAPHAFLVHPSLPARSVEELSAHIRAHPEAIAYASTGIGSVQHLGTELYAQRAGGLRMNHVPYRAVGPAIADLLAGRIQLFLTTTPPVQGFVQDGRLRALALTAEPRLPTLPALPTAREAGLPGFDLSTWTAVFAPAATPTAARERLEREILAALDAPALRRRALEQGAVLPGGGATALGARVRREAAEWRAVVQAANITDG